MIGQPCRHIKTWVYNDFRSLCLAVTFLFSLFILAMEYSSRIETPLNEIFFWLRKIF